MLICWITIQRPRGFHVACCDWEFQLQHSALGATVGLGSGSMSTRCAASVLAFFGGSFVMHFAWELAQMPLFKSANASTYENVQMCLFATATGDMLFMLTLYLTAAVIHRDCCWLTDRAVYSHPATWSVLILVGMLLAVSFELWSVHAVRRWEYGSSMPLVPFIRVGVTPILQMVLIPPASIAICRFTAFRVLDALAV
jgi:hypothetical protein